MDRKKLKKDARQAMSAAKPAPFWVILAATAITMVLAVLTMSLDGTLTSIRTMYAAALEGQLVYVEPQAAGGLLGWVLGVAVQVMTVEIGVGVVIYALRIWRREKAGLGDVFDSFGVFFRSIWITLLPSLLMSLWSAIYVIPVSTLILMTGQVWWVIVGLPLMIPALQAIYAYRLATYLMLDNPQLSCWQCVALSRQIMRGHKWEAFVLDLSFLGWMLLGLIPVAGLIALVWVSAYQQVTNAGYYDRVLAVYMAYHESSPGPQPPAV